MHPQSAPYLQPRPIVTVLLCAIGLVGCDTLETAEQETAVNPYTDITNTYTEAASAAVEYAQSQTPTNPKDVEQRLVHGYRIWVAENRSTAQKAFRTFRELRSVQTSVQKYVSQRPKVKSTHSLSVDSLLVATELSSAQKSRIQSLSSLVEKRDSLSEIKSKLDRFDKETAERLDKESRRVVLQLSAVVRAQFEFMKGIDPMKVASLFGGASSLTEKLRTQKSADRPKLDEYVDSQAVLREAMKSGLAGLGAGGACGPVYYVCGPAFAAGAAVAGATWTYGSQVRKYQRDLADWCSKVNNHHPNCDDHLP